MKKLFGTLSILVLLAVVGSYAILAYLNNRSVPKPDHARIQDSFNAAVTWLARNETKILEQGNPALWWMVQRSAALTGDATLQAAFERYRERHLQGGRNIWEPLFFTGRWIPFKNEDIAHFDDYQQHFIYAISCDSELGATPLIQAQLSPDYCDRYPWRPACVTHQLIGFRLMQISHCGDADAVQLAIGELQKRIVRQLTWDPRVVDVYMQRVLMLTDSGASGAIKPIWLLNILEAQRVDGGWAGIDPLIPLPGNHSLGFGPRGFTLKEPQSDFHVTAQGILLMSLLLDQDVRQD